MKKKLLELKSWWAWKKECAYLEESMIAYDEQRKATWLDTVKIWGQVFYQELLALKCQWSGHDYIADNADVENGSEDLSCARCGHSERIYWGG